jgi:hypothetical protein
VLLAMATAIAGGTLARAGSRDWPPSPSLQHAQPGGDEGNVGEDQGAGRTILAGLEHRPGCVGFHAPGGQALLNEHLRGTGIPL